MELPQQLCGEMLVPWLLFAQLVLVLCRVYMGDCPDSSVTIAMVLR